MIEKRVVLAVSHDRAFALFTEQIDAWWPSERRHIQPGPSVVVLTHERFFEVSGAGLTVELGAIRAWEPPHRIVLDWYPGTGADAPTEVEVTFVAEGETATRVSVVHRAGPRSVELFPTRAPRYDGSWNLVLAALEGAAHGA